MSATKRRLGDLIERLQEFQSVYGSDLLVITETRCPPDEAMVEGAYDGELDLSVHNVQEVRSGFVPVEWVFNGGSGCDIVTALIIG